MVAVVAGKSPFLPKKKEMKFYFFFFRNYQVFPATTATTAL
jgi:hypothetical protein